MVFLISESVHFIEVLFSGQIVDFGVDEGSFQQWRNLFVWQIKASKGGGINFSLVIEKTKTMNLFLIILSFVLAYGVFALVAFKLVKVLFPSSDTHEKPWKIKTPDM